MERPIKLCAGGWFVIDEERGWSGPWNTLESAQAAERGYYAVAHKLHNEARYVVRGQKREQNERL